MSDAPAPARVPTSAAAPRPPRRGLFRWRAIGPLLLAALLLGVLVWLFAEPVVEQTAEEAATKALGTQVEIGKLDIYPRNSGLRLRALQVADPFDPMRNALVADEIDLRVDPVALAEKKVVIDGLTLSGLRFGVPRETRARPAAKDGFAATLLGEMAAFRKQFDVPLLSLTPIDTVRQLALDPGQLRTVQAAQRLVATADSGLGRVGARLDSLRLEAVLDSARALADSVAALDVKSLTAEQAARVAARVRGALDAVNGAKQRLRAVEAGVRREIRDAREGVRALDAARQADYAFARGLIQLPTFNAPDLGKALFGEVSIDRFQRALYWTSVAQQHLPPGLQPRQDEGPSRLRMAGTTVRYPKERSYPEFLLRAGKVDLTVAGDGPLAGAYVAQAGGITTQPALYGKPMTFAVRRDAAGSAVARVEVRGVLDHVGAVMRDSVTVAASGLALPAFDLPGLPLRLEPGRGGARLDFVKRGDAIRGRWRVRSDAVQWRPDSAAGRGSDLLRFVTGAITRVGQLELEAEIGGTVARPELAIRSNLDQVVAGALRAQLGAEIDRAEQKVRAEVNRLVQDQQARAEQEVARLTGALEGRLGGATARLGEAEQALDAQLKQLTSRAGGLIRLPKLKL